MDPLVLDIHAAVVEITHVVLSWLEEAEQLLTNTGLELPTSKKGACSRGIPTLCSPLGSQRLVGVHVCTVLSANYEFGKLELDDLGGPFQSNHPMIL